MSVDIAGNFTRQYNWTTDAAGGIKIQSGRMDDEFNNYATALNLAFWRDGRTALTGDLKLGGFKAIGAALGSASVCSYSFMGGSGQATGLFSPGAGQAALAAGGVELLRVVSTGVGIGGTSPDSLLQVNGGALGGLRIAYNETSVNFIDGDANYFRNAAGTNNVYIDANGNVALRGTITATNIGTAAAYAAGANAPGQLLILDGSGLIPVSALPALTVNKTFVNTSQAAMLANAANVGDIAVRTDINESFILQIAPASTLGNWIQLLSPTAAVSSVAGRVGAVVLTHDDIGGLGSFATKSSLTSTEVISYLTFTPMNAASYGNVENKSSATIRGEITLTNLNAAAAATDATATVMRIVPPSGSPTTETGRVTFGTGAAPTLALGEIYLQY